MDGLDNDFDRMMHLGEDSHHNSHNDSDRNHHLDRNHHDSEDYPTHQLKDSLLRARETCKDKSALHHETSRSIGTIRHVIHKNAAYKDDMLERESREGRDSLRRTRVEG